MTERERLKEMLEKAIRYADTNYKGRCEDGKYCGLMADHLLANGVIVPPCKVGDAYYTIEKYCNADPYETEKELVRAWDCGQWCGRSDCSFMEYRIYEHKFNSVIKILENQKYFGKYYFLTKEEAEEALKERSEGK